MSSSNLQTEWEKDILAQQPLVPTQADVEPNRAKQNEERKTKCTSKRTRAWSVKRRGQGAIHLYGQSQSSHAVKNICVTIHVRVGKGSKELFPLAVSWSIALKNFRSSPLLLNLLLDIAQFIAACGALCTRTLCLRTSCKAEPSFPRVSVLRLSSPMSQA